MSGAAAGATNAAAEARRLAHALAAASDQALTRAVAVFDRLAERREADQVLDAARPRLRRLRPPRPITLPRLLFLPLDGVIEDAKGWKRSAGSLPRSALPPIATMLREAIAPEAAEIEAAIADATFSDLAAVGRAGGRLWQAAAEAAPRLEPPTAWGETGLRTMDFRNAITLCSGVWRHAAPLWAALAEAREGPPETLVRAAMEDAAAEEAIIREAMLATLLMKAARPGTVANAAARALPGPAIEAALERWMEESKPDFAVGDAQGAARLAEDFVRAIEDLETSGALRHPERRQRLQALRSEVSEACRETYAATIARSVIEPLKAQGTRLSDAAASAMEEAARSLRRLDLAGRSLGGGIAYDSVLRRVIDAFAELHTAAEANPADLARLTEILAGPEAAMKLLDPG